MHGSWFLNLWPVLFRHMDIVSDSSTLYELTLELLEFSTIWTSSGRTYKHDLNVIPFYTDGLWTNYVIVINGGFPVCFTCMVYTVKGGHHLTTWSLLVCGQSGVSCRINNDTIKQRRLLKGYDIGMQSKIDWLGAAIYVQFMWLHDDIHVRDHIEQTFVTLYGAMPWIRINLHPSPMLATSAAFGDDVWFTRTALLHTYVALTTYQHNGILRKKFGAHILKAMNVWTAGLAFLCLFYLLAIAFINSISMYYMERLFGYRWFNVHLP